LLKHSVAFGLLSPAHVSCAAPMNLFAHFQDKLAAVLDGLKRRGVLPASADLGRATVEAPRDPSHGDLATNAAMVLAKEAGQKPRDLAELIAEDLRAVEGVVAVEIAGPGFINLRIDGAFYDKALLAAVASGARFGIAAKRPEDRINVEYVSANPTGPMHVGHCRGAVFGDALAALLEAAGHDVNREYYINDAGAQVDVLARSAFLRYREALGERIGAIPEGLYPGDYLVPVGKALKAKFGPTLHNQPESEWLPVVRQIAIDMMMAMIRDDLGALNVRHDQFFSERSLQTPQDKVGETIADLRARGFIYEGRLERPKGAVDEDWEDRVQTLFKATEFGDDVDRPLMKSDGSYTYFANDIAYHANKFARGTPVMIDVWGADHGGYIKRMTAATRATTAEKGSLEIQIVQLVKLMRNGEPVKMSKRSGSFVTLREVVDEVGVDAVRFMMLYRKNDATLEFDLAKVVEQSKDNPVFYVQYAHARCHSILRQAMAKLPGMPIDAAALGNADLTQLSDPAERALMRQIAAYPRLIEAAAAQREPHRIAFYLYELAGSFHALWNMGNERHDLRFVIESDETLSQARIALVFGLKSVLNSGLSILGVSAPEEMR
jgi:arginyl-tRNA synthetase